MFAVRYRNICLRPSLFRQIRRSVTINSSQSANTSQQKSGNKEKRSDGKEVQDYRAPLSEEEIQKIINTDKIMYVTKFQHKKPEREPLLQNFFIGEVDTELLTYPQVMTQKEVAAMEELISVHQQYFVNEIKESKESPFRDISEKMLDDFRRLKLFGANVHQRFGGMGNFTSEMCWLTETEAIDLKSFFVLAAHRLAVEAITDHGSENHQIEYLADMAKGLF